VKPDDPLIWMENARCRGLDPNLFVPSFNPKTRQGPPPEAFRVCNGDDTKWNGTCPVRKECLAYGKQHNATGCFGGKALYNGRVRRDRHDS
jgi:hypothetical protein